MRRNSYKAAVMIPPFETRHLKHHPSDQFPTAHKAHLPILSETPTSIIAAKMHLSKQILTVVTALLFASAGVQAGCTTESPGTQGFYGGKCNSDNVFCGYAPSGGYSITCCDTKACE
uniref:Uncharacterized protein n=2 Tax=Colletotrichum fructicola (strain Nara gc5) TaxID=1213859 RepID=L2G3V7_COLFN